MTKITLAEAWKKINEIDTKQQTHEEIMDNFAIAIVELRTDVKEIKENMMTKQDKNEILALVDGLTCAHMKSDQEQTMHSHRLREHSNILEKHTEEIKQLQRAAK